MKGFIVVILAALACAFGAASGASAGVVQSDGGFICDGFTGCYILAGGVAVLADSCNGNFTTGPFRCTSTRTVSSPATKTLVYPNAACSEFIETEPSVFVQIYGARGTVILRQVGTTVTFTANCGTNQL
jgi:hypothetical protein